MLTDIPTILTWVSIITGGLLVLFLILSLLAGLDLDFDIESPDPESSVDGDAGGLGVIKGFLTFISVSTWVIKALLVSNKHLGIAVAIGIFAGAVALLLLNYLLKLLMSNVENVNWKTSDALHQTGTVYLKIPADGKGIVNVEVNGALREINAKSVNNQEIKTGETIEVVSVENDIVFVKIKQN